MLGTPANQHAGSAFESVVKHVVVLTIGSKKLSTSLSLYVVSTHPSNLVDSVKRLGSWVRQRVSGGNNGSNVQAGSSRLGWGIDLECQQGLYTRVLVDTLPSRVSCFLVEL